MDRSDFLLLAVFPLLVGCGTFEPDSAVITSQNFIRFECKADGHADDAAKQINEFAIQFGATAEASDITVGEPGKVVIVRRGLLERGGLQLLFAYQGDGKTVEIFGTKIEAPTANDRSFISTIMENAPIKDCKSIEI